MDQKILDVLNRNNLTSCTSVISQLEVIVLMKISMKKRAKKCTGLSKSIEKEET